MTQKPVMPTEVSKNVGTFDRFAEGAARVASRAWFFCFCVLLVVVWAPSILIIRSIDTWQLIINTMTTIVTFLMVALLQNSQMRADQAVQHKLNAIAGSLSDLMASQSLEEDARELRAAVGLEQHESTSKNSEEEVEAREKKEAQKKEAQKKEAQTNEHHEHSEAHKEFSA